MAIGLRYGTAGGDIISRVNSDTGDPTADFGPWPTGTTLTAWTAMTGGTQITELYDSAQNPVSVVTVTGPLYRTIFYGPSTIAGAIWLQDPSGNRWRFDPDNLASRVAGVTSVSVDGGPAQTGDVNVQTGGSVAAADLIDAGLTGVNSIRANTQADGRTAIGAGTSNLQLGLTANTAKAGNYVPSKADVGLGNVDNTSDLAKPVSTATAAAIKAIAPVVVLDAGAPDPNPVVPGTLYLRKVAIPTLRDVGTYAIANAATSTYTVPTTAVVGDLLIMVVVGGGFALTGPLGWTLQKSSTTPTTNNQISMYVWAKQCGTTDPGSVVSVAGAGINRKIGLIMALRDAPAGIDVSAGIADETVNVVTRTAASAVTTQRSVPILFATDRAGATTPASATWTFPAGYTTVFTGRGSANVNTGEVSLGIAMGPVVEAGATAGGGSYTGDTANSKAVSELVTVISS
jgi:hypothetical protein